MRTYVSQSFRISVIIKYIYEVGKVLTSFAQSFRPLNFLCTHLCDRKVLLLFLVFEEVLKTYCGAVVHSLYTFHNEINLFINLYKSITANYRRI